MKKNLSQLTKNLRRPTYSLAALLMMFVAVGQVIPVSAGQVQDRKIMLSDNGVSGGTITTGVGSGTNVTYRVVFKAASTFTIRGVVVDFCSGSGTPFIDDATCPAPTSFNVGTTPTIDETDWTLGANPTIEGLETTTPTAWTTDSLNSGQTFRMTNTEGKAVTADTEYTFAITGVTNPSVVETFYARLILYASDTGDVATYDHDAAGAYTDYGGFALNVAEIVQVSAKVQEALSFCVSGYSAAATAPATPGEGTAPINCSDVTVPAITLGHGTNNTLEAGMVDINEVWTIVSTNALSGVSIRMRNSNACGGLSLDGGATCPIAPNNAGADTPSAIDAGDAFFGMFCEEVAGGDGDVDCDPGYNDGALLGPEVQPITTTTAAGYGMDTTTSGDNVATTYGDTVASSIGPVNAKTNRFQFAASASNTTPAGIYRANLAMIATGTF